MINLPYYTQSKWVFRFLLPSGSLWCSSGGAVPRKIYSVWIFWRLFLGAYFVWDGTKFCTCYETNNWESFSKEVLRLNCTWSARNLNENSNFKGNFYIILDQLKSPSVHSNWYRMDIEKLWNRHSRFHNFLMLNGHCPSNTNLVDRKTLVLVNEEKHWCKTSFDIPIFIFKLRWPLCEYNGPSTKRKPDYPMSIQGF